MGYEQFFGLSDAPFSLAPNPRYLFESASHAHALQQLAYATERREPVVVVTGEIGSGKTLLCRTVLQRLDRGTTFVSVINNPLLERDDLLKQMLQDFGVISTDRATAPGATRHDLVHALEGFLTSLISLDAHAVVMIDEAQHMQPDVLEQIRLLSNIDAPSGTRLQIMLVGPLELESVLERPDLRQFQQRVSRRIRLEPLREDELQAYIEHRLAVGRAAGSGLPGAGDLAEALAQWNGEGVGVTFTPDAVRAVWRGSAGLPRVVNLLCDRALEAAYHRQLRTIDADLVETGAADRLPQTTAPLPATREPASTDIWVPPPPAETAIESMPPPFEEGAATAPRSKLVPALIGVLAVGVVVAWFVYRTPTTATDSRPTPSGGQASAAAPATQPPPAAPSAEPAAASAPPAPRPATAAPEPSAGAAPPAAAPGAAASSSFEIVVASFRTESRAAAVATQVSGAGLAVRRRVIGGWQQVIAGPFASREEADAARQRLEQAGLPGTQVVSATP
jgi:general secretion pathway protein A